ncbi:MAG TPA: enoyl-CoA hydratase-related protein [Nevskia sp.]|nr:enoyl-CoA hydratase-related protein [Nevskia sp.]
MSADIALGNDGQGLYTLTMGQAGKACVVTRDSCLAMTQALRQVREDGAARVLVLRSAGKSFNAGGDISAISATLVDSDRLLGGIIDAFHESILALRRLPVPVIGSVFGAAAGGGFSLALACDLLVAARSARFVAAYPALGTSSDGGLSHYLRRRLGAMKALEIVLGGPLGAAEAQALGLVARVVDDGQLEAETLAYARQIAQMAPQSVQAFKQLLGAAEDAELEAQLARERAAFLGCARTEDFRNRVQAFLQKRG